VELTDGCYSEGGSQGLPGFIHPRVLGIPTISCLKTLLSNAFVMLSATPALPGAPLHPHQVWSAMVVQKPNSVGVVVSRQFPPPPPTLLVANHQSRHIGRAVIGRSQSGSAVVVFYCVWVLLGGELIRRGKILLVEG